MTKNPSTEAILELTLSGKSSKVVRTASLEPNFGALYLLTMSVSVAETIKYCCFKRSSFPSKNWKKIKKFKDIHVELISNEQVISRAIFKWASKVIPFYIGLLYFPLWLVQKTCSTFFKPSKDFVTSRYFGWVYFEVSLVLKVNFFSSDYHQN